MWHLWGRRKKAYRILRRNPKERKHLEDVGVDGRILNGSSRNMTGWRDWIRKAQDREQGQVACSYEYGSETSGTITYGEFIDKLKTIIFENKDSAPWSWLFL
jgi:hypothetical protein